LHQRGGLLRPPQVYSYPLRCGCDASALSRFVHHVVDADLCLAEAVVIVATDDAIADRGCLGVLNLVIGRLASRRVLTVVVSQAGALLQTLDHGAYPNFADARFVASEGDAAHLILVGARLPR
jgi:hypothetical protein